MPITNTPFGNYFFNPLSIGGCALWLDASDTTTLTLSGSSVTQWRDKSGSNYHCVNTTTSNYPTYSSSGFNSFPTLQWTSSVQMVAPVPAGTFPTTLTMFVVFQSTAPLSGQNGLISRANTANSQPAPFDMVSIYASSFTYRLIGNGAGNYNFTNQPDLRFFTATPSIYMMTVDNTPSWTEFMNGSNQNVSVNLSGAIYADTATQIQMNSRNAFTGNMSEVMMFKSVLTTDQRQQIEGYLAQKYGLTSSLAAGHPGLSRTFIKTERVPLTTLSTYYLNFRPTQITGCQLWLDGTDPVGTGVQPSNGTTITTWTDKSSSGNSTNSGNGVFYSNYQNRNGVIYISASTYMGLPNLTIVPVTIFFVGKLLTNTANSFFLALGATNGNAIYLRANFPNSFYGVDNGSQTTTPSSGGGRFNIPTTNQDSTYHVWSYTQTSNSEFFFDGTSMGSITSPNNTTSTTFTGNTLGGWNSTPNSVDSVICEVLMYNSVLSTTQRQTIESYLAQKWNLQGSLPRNHLEFTTPAGMPSWVTSVARGIRGSTAALFDYVGTLTFTPAGATGASGPTLSQCRTAYSSFGAWVNNSAYFNMTTQGIQRWTVPTTRTYTVVCAGAGKANANGSVLTATLSLTAGQIINIMVGQPSTGNGGSGGTFIVSATNTAILVAGGGGGGSGGVGGGGASLTTSGSAGGTSTGSSSSIGCSFNVTSFSGAAGSGGSAGNGGGPGGGGSVSSGGCNPNRSTTTSIGGAGGGGFSGNGTGSTNTNINAGITNLGGTSYTGGGAGGGGGSGATTGGFGGGGSSGTSGYFGYICCPSNFYQGSGGTATGGGGGGYSGGGGGGDNGSFTSIGGGGASYSSVTLSASSVTNVGAGYVSIT